MKCVTAGREEQFLEIAEVPSRVYGNYTHMYLLPKETKAHFLNGMLINGDFFILVELRSRNTEP